MKCENIPISPFDTVILLKLIFHFFFVCKASLPSISYIFLWVLNPKKNFLGDLTPTKYSIYMFAFTNSKDIYISFKNFN